MESDGVKKDIFGRPIELGQWAVFLKPNARILMYGRVIKITDKNVRIEYEGVKWKWKKVAGKHERVQVPATALSCPSEIAIVDEGIVFWHKLQKKAGQK